MIKITAEDLNSVVDDIRSLSQTHEDQGDCRCDICNINELVQKNFHMGQYTTLTMLAVATGLINPVKGLTDALASGVIFGLLIAEKRTFAAFMDEAVKK